MEVEIELDAAVAEDSVETRYPASAVPAISGMRLSPGGAVTIVNISASGALVEGTGRFVPGTRLTVHFEGTMTPSQINARVVRCTVSAIGAGGVLQYHSGIAFETRLNLSIGETVEPPMAAAPIEASRTTTAADTGAERAAASPPRVFNRW